jgi:hypothetical protein
MRASQVRDFGRRVELISEVAASLRKKIGSNGTEQDEAFS